MTTQISDVLIFDNTHVYLSDLLLPAAFKDPCHLDSVFSMISTACSRGYVAIFAVFDGRLMLVSIDGNGKDSRTVGIRDLFNKSMLQATWVSGRVEGQFGRRIGGDYKPVLENSISLVFDHGVLEKCEKRKNEPPPPSRLLAFLNSE
ncbi:hypothetical protein [Paraburkholderia sp. MM6662-R1]|uniref:hypothetical protein n=1 Tax=Paraburkholderia sp. MM6662-R1 TaxID=2991066 RepID=UPI003D1D263B